MGNSSDTSRTGNLFDTNMTSSLVVAISLLGGMLMDVFILTVNLRDWVKKKPLSTTDKILTLQGGIRICLGCTTMTWSILEKLCRWITQIRYFLKVFMFCFWYFTSYNIWLMASLCSYYCVKIADFSHPFFIHLKRRLSGLESAWLLGSAVLALPSSLPFVCSDWETQGDKNFPDFFQNKNVTGNSDRMMALGRRLLPGFGYFAAFSICAISVVLLLLSLWRHRQRMQDSWGGHRSPQMDAHLQAVVTILLLLIVSIIVFICIQVLLSKDFEISSMYHLVGSVVLFSCFSVESLISAWGNKKLKSELRRYLNFVKCRGCVC